MNETWTVSRTELIEEMNRQSEPEDDKFTNEYHVHTDDELIKMDCDEFAYQYTAITGNIVESFNEDEDTFEIS